MGLYKVERPEIEAWDFDEYVRILNAARAAGEDWYAAVCLAGEAGLRVGTALARGRRHARADDHGPAADVQRGDDHAQGPHPAHDPFTRRSSACRSSARASWFATSMARRRPTAR